MTMYCEGCQQETTIGGDCRCTPLLPGQSRSVVSWNPACSGSCYSEFENGQSCSRHGRPAPTIAPKATPTLRECGLCEGSGRNHSYEDVWTCTACYGTGEVEAA